MITYYVARELQYHIIIKYKVMYYVARELRYDIMIKYKGNVLRS